MHKMKKRRTDKSILGGSSFFVFPENIRIQETFRCFQGVEESSAGLKWVQWCSIKTCFLLKAGLYL